MSNKKSKVGTNKIVLHSIFPLVYFLVLVFKNTLQNKFPHFCLSDIIYYFFSAFILTYIYLCSVILYRSIWDKKQENSNSLKNTLLSKWTRFIYLEIMIITFAPLILYWFKDLKETDSIYQPVSCIMLLIMCCKIVCCPEIFYGYTHLKSKINEVENNPLKFRTIWILSDKTNPTGIQDQLLKRKIDPSLSTYIAQIELLIHNDNFFFRSDIKIENLSSELKIPKSHLNYIFKYHSSVSFVEFKKMIKIHYATILIKNNYLQTNTLNYLSKEVGFASYDPFYRSFKKHTGNTPLDYHNLLRAKISQNESE
ncbi:AraC family transcriptional regulator [Flavobacterium sp. AC]|uniref:AraC family transcriptional regulator n=1 Tax=Flavobacterium azizsancarii TaxID=2961580 RepID=A0ABT4WGC3_9FLAO|nr:AraC family transcriptional regulator [Flavobacterium azizsancarii]MDA6071540.1 AraC family transcriptional regulator [Flavobacterium azizsancarii]